MSKVYLLKKRDTFQFCYNSILATTSKEVIERFKYLQQIFQLTKDDDYEIEEFDLIESLDDPVLKFPDFIIVGGTIDVFKDHMTTDSIVLYVAVDQDNKFVPFTIWATDYGLVEYKVSVPVLKYYDGKSVEEIHEVARKVILENYLKFKEENPKKFQEICKKVKDRKDAVSKKYGHVFLDGCES